MVPTNESGESERRPGLCIAERGIENNPVMIYTELQCCVHKTRNNTFDIDNIEELGKFFLDLAYRSLEVLLDCQKIFLASIAFAASRGHFEVR